jgi:subtilisin family serine protease
MPQAEAASTDYDYLSKIDRDLMKVIQSGESTSVGAIIVASSSLSAVRKLVISNGGSVRIPLEGINALAVTLPCSSVETIAKSSSVNNVWLDQQIALAPQSDVFNLKAELMQTLTSKVAEKADNVEKTGEDRAVVGDLNSELYAIPENGMLSLEKNKEIDISLQAIGIADVSPQTYFTYQVGAENLWAMGYAGAGTYIAVLDNGATASHPMIADAVIGGHSEVPSEPNWDSVLGDHGTMTSSMAVGRPVIAVMPDYYDLAAAMARWFPDKIIPAGTYPWGTIPDGYIGIAFIGEAPSASLWVEKVLTYAGSGATSWILAGMQHVLTLRKTTSIHIDVVSMSLGLPQPWSAVNDGTDPWSRMVDLLVNNGITVAQSTGNQGPGAFTISQSAVARKNIGVGGYVYARMFKMYLDWYYGYPGSSLAHMGDDDEMVWYFASRGPTRDYRTGVAVVAPCAFTIGGAGYADLYWGSGTSFSAPRVAGEALLLIQYFKAQKGVYPAPETVRAAIVVGADYIAGYQKIDEGGGHWNPYKASQEIFKKDIIWRASFILNSEGFHAQRVCGALRFTNGVSEKTVASLGIEHFSRFYFILSDPDMYRISITNIAETYTGMNTLYMWVYDPKGDLANIGQVWRSGDNVLNYGQTGYYGYLVGQTQYSGVYKWNQHWTPMDPGIWEVVVENDYYSWESVGFTIRVEKSEVSMTACANSVELRNRGVDIGLSAPGGLKAYEGYSNTICGWIKQNKSYTTTFNVLPGTKELFVSLDWDDDYSREFPADLDLYLIDPTGYMWVGYDPPVTPMGIFGGTVNIPETDYFGDYTAGNIVPGTWTVIVFGYKIGYNTGMGRERFTLYMEGRVRDVTRPTKTYGVENPEYFFEAPNVPTMLFSGDDTYAAYTLPFSFPFYDGEDYTTIYVGSNGYITLDAGLSSYNPSAYFLDHPMIAVMAEDLVTTAYAIPHGNYVTILWYGRLYGETSTRDLMFAQLYDNGDIIMSYADWVSPDYWGRDAIAGLSKGDGSTSVTISPTASSAFQFTYSATIISTDVWSYVVNSIPYTYAPGSTLLFSGDDAYGTYTLPFSFPFYGTNYNTIYVGSNGYITFDQGYTSYSPSTIWSDIFLQVPTIAPMGRDLVSEVYVTDHGNYVTISWFGRAYGSPPDHDLMLVELYDNGDIVISYSDWLGTPVVAGVSKGDGSTYTTIDTVASSSTSFQFVYTLTTIEYKLVSYTITDVPFVWEPVIPPLVSGDDAYGTYTLPFSFPFCGSSYNTAYVGTNGYITFDTGYTYYSDASILNMFMSAPTIAVMARDLITTVYAIPHGNYVSIIWYGRAFGDPTGSERWLMLAQLYDNGAIVMSYNDWISGLAGVSDGDGSNYVQISPSDQTTWRITVTAIIPPAIVFANPNPWLPAGATVKVYYTTNVAGNYIFASKHYWVEKFFRDGGVYASTFGRFLYENAEAQH